MWDKKVRQNCDTPFIEKLLIPEYFWKTEWFAHDVFRRLGTKRFRRKNVTPPSYPYFFSVLENFWNTKAFPTKFFGTVRLKLFHGKSLNSYFMHKVVGWPSFYESLKGSPTKNSAPWDKKVQKSRDSLLSKIFSIPKLSELQGSSYETFWYCETKTINKIVIPVLSKKFWNQNNSETQAGWPTMICGVVRQKKDKIVIPLLSKIFWYQSNSETQEGAPTMFFGNLGQKKFDGKTWHPPFYP